MADRARGHWASSIAFWALVGLFLSVQNHLIEIRLHSPDSTIADALINTMPNAIVWAAFSPAIVWLAGRFPIGRATWKTVAPLHAVIGCLVAGLHTLLAVSLFALFWLATGHPVSWPVAAYRHLVLFFDWNLVVYAALAAIGTAGAYYRESRERERRALTLETQLANARLQALKGQLHPHFLFNALNGIAELIHEDRAVAERMVLGLASLLRTLLEEAAAQEVPLEQELQFIRAYLEIEQMRFQDRLAVGWEVDPAVLRAIVPSLVLQPLVENALRHGVARRAGACRIVIRALAVRSTLVLRVSDDGPGFRRDAAGRIAEGLGLSNTRARLGQLHGADGKLELADARGAGAEVTVVIPLRTAAARSQQKERADGGEAPDAHR